MRSFFLLWAIACVPFAAFAQELQLREFAGSEILGALRAGDLVETERTAVQLLGYARISQDGSAIEISSDCKTWKALPLDDVLLMHETLVPSENCGDQKLPFVKLSLKQGAAAPGSVLTYSARRIGGGGFRRPGFIGGGLGVSDTVWEACVDKYLDCQIEECAGKGQWCLNMCEYEFDFCVSDR